MSGRKVTHVDVARRLKCDPSMASYMHSGRRMPGAELLITMIFEYDLDPLEAMRAHMGGVETFSAFVRERIYGETDDPEAVDEPDTAHNAA